MLQQSIFKEYHALVKYGLRLFDLIVVILTACAAYYYRFGDLQLSTHYQNTLWIALVASFLCFQQFKLYVPIRGRSLFSYLVDTTFALIASMALLAASSFLTKSAVILSREWFLLWLSSAWVCLVLSRCFLWWLARVFRLNGWNPRRVVIVGTNELALNLLREMQKTLGDGFKVIAFITDDPSLNKTKIHRVPVRLMPKRIEKWLRLTFAHEIWIALPLREEEKIKQLLFEFRNSYLTVRYVFDIFGLSLHQHRMTQVAGFPVINLLSTPLVGFNRAVKYLEDKLLASIILLLISPVMLCIAIAIKLTSRGPIVFKQRRHGSSGEEIIVYKFRSMYQHNESQGQVTQASKQDGRITPIGRFLRKTSLDELPQFVNVLQGRMSIVGPRPHAVEHNEYYRELITSYMQRHRVKPGITGWAQVNGFRGNTDKLEKMQKRIDYDTYYIENWSLSLDLKIIFLTIVKGFFDRNAY
jgi:putative colanic acid biosynthesis UDP-glucose lipid carrier transferase